LLTSSGAATRYSRSCIVVSARKSSVWAALTGAVAGWGDATGEPGGAGTVAQALSSTASGNSHSRRRQVCAAFPLKQSEASRVTRCIHFSLN